MGPEGDTSFQWDATDDNWVLPMIRQKMEEGYTFWVIKRNPLREEEADSADDIGDARTVIIRDTDARRLFEQGHIRMMRPGDRPVEATTRARNAEQAVAADTVAHAPLRGG
jgi:hypothetical protein